MISGEKRTFHFFRKLIYFRREQQLFLPTVNDDEVMTVFHKKRKKQTLFALLLGVVLLGILCRYGGGITEIGEIPVALSQNSVVVSSEVKVVSDVADLAVEAAAMEGAPAALPQVMTAVASNVHVKKNAKAVIDYSNAKEGYVMVQYIAKTSQRLKVQVKGPTTQYTYNLLPGEWESFPLSDGNGSYQITIYQNVAGNKYASVLSLSTEVTLVDEFSPFLHSNQYVDFDAAPKSVEKATELTKGLTSTLKKVEAVYDYVVMGLSYDKVMAAGVKSGYLPVLDEVLEKKSGICFDYAALMTGMLRSQGVPCKLVVGYAGAAYHAWISVWSEETGWVDGVVYFNGTSWQRMDPTFASSGKGSQAIMAYIGNGKNYSAKYFY